MKKGFIVDFEKCNFMTKEQILISQQRNQGEKLRLKLKSIQEEVLGLKHHYEQLTRLLKPQQSNDQLKKSIQLINTQNTEAKSSLKNFEQLQQKKFSSIIRNLDNIQNYQQQQFQSSLSTMQQQLLTSFEKILDQKMKLFQNQIRSVKQNIESITQQIHKRQKSSYTSQKLMNFINELKIIFQDNISQQEMYQLQKMNFNQVTLNINEQIVRLRRQVDSLRRAIIQFREGYILTDIQLKTQGNTAQQLARLENQHQQLNQEITLITRQNETLQSNMQQQVNKIVDQKINSIDLESYQHVNKYLIASQCILKKFGAILPKEELDQFMAQLQRSQISANQKFNQLN